MLTRWSQAAEADATIERLTVLRTRSAQAMELALNEPAIRRYLGARLGPEAVIVRPGQGPALQDALAEHGMLGRHPRRRQWRRPCVKAATIRRKRGTTFLATCPLFVFAPSADR